MIKKIFCDVDGTLVTDEGELTDNTIAKIKAIKDKNIDFVITTGRPIAGLRNLFNQYGDYLSCICVLGADYHNNQGQRIFEHPITTLAAKKIYDLQQSCQNNGLAVFARDSFIVCREVKQFLYDTYKIDKLPKDGPISQWAYGIHYEKDINEIVKLPIYKMEFHTDTSKQCQILMHKLKQIADINPCLASETNIEVTALGVSKGAMIKQICQSENISLDDIVTIGDSGNDISMLEGFKHAVAMGNSPQEIKEICSHQTTDNNHEGVSKFLDYILENNCCL